MAGEFIFGIHAVQTLLNTTPQDIRGLQVQRGRDDRRLKQLLSLAESLDIPVQVVARQRLDELVDGRHQGVIAETSGGKLYDEAYLYEMLEGLEQTPLLLVLDGVTDPHNLGACMRSAAAAGAHAVVAPRDNSAKMNSVARKVACGGAEVVPYILVTNLVRTLKRLQEQGVWLIGTAGEATELLYDIRLSGPTALILGAEGKGMRRLTRETCDQLASIPLTGAISSLNVSVAAGVCLFEAVRQRQSQ